MPHISLCLLALVMVMLFIGEVYQNYKKGKSVFQILLQNIGFLSEQYESSGVNTCYDTETRTIAKLFYASSCVWLILIYQNKHNQLTGEAEEIIGQIVALCAHCVCTAWAPHAHCVHTTTHAEAGILTQEYLSPEWLHSAAAKPT